MTKLSIPPLPIGVDGGGAGDGIQLDAVEKLIADDPEAVALYREATIGTPGAHPNDNIIRRAEQGTSSAYTLDRLQRGRPELYAKVVASSAGR